MPTGDNPNSRKNLIRPSRDLTVEEQRRRASKAGKASGVARSTSKTLTEALKKQLTPELMDELTMMLIKRAKTGNLKAYELLRDQVGEKPVEHVSVSQVDPETVNELKQAILKRSAENELHDEQTGSDRASS